MVLQLPNCTDPVNSDSDIFSNFQSYDWAEGTLLSAGLDSVKIEEGLSTAATQSFIHSMLIIRKGKLVAERYFRGYQKNEPHIVRSVSKSYLSAMVGIAIREGFIESTEDKISKYLPECKSQDYDERIQNITIENLLTMRSGIKTDHEFYSETFDSDDWLNTILSEPLDSDPGERYAYSTPATHLLNIVLTRATGMPSLEFAQKYLLDALGIEIGFWEKDPQGYYFGGNNMYFTPRDMARLGYLYLHDGNLNGQQVVPQEWVEKSLTDTRNTPDAEWGELKKLGYGYLWWLGEVGGRKTFAAVGHGGQFIFVFPDADMIVVSTADGYVDWDEADRDERLIIQIIADYFVPAIL